MALDSITPDGSTITIGQTPSIVITTGTTIAVNMGTDAGDDLNLVNNSLVIEGDTGRCGFATAAPGAHVHIKTTTGTTSGLRIEGTNVTGAFFQGGGLDFAMGTTSDHIVELIVNDFPVVTISKDRGLFMGPWTTDPSTRADRVGIFAKDVSGSMELFGIDELNNKPQLTPHDPVTGEVYLYTTNGYTGKVLRIWHERAARLLEATADHLGITHDPIIEEDWLPREELADWDADQAARLAEDPSYEVKPMPDYMRAALAVRP